MKRPSFQFYPADWRKDVELQSCSMAAQGLWINCMCLAHECEPYGHLTINGKAMTSAQLGRQVGLSPKEAESLMDELLDAGVARKTDDGVIYSSRMVRDERLRNIRAESGRLGGNPALLGNKVKQKDNQKVNQGDKQTATPSSSSSSSSSDTSGRGGKPPADKAKAELWKAAVSLLEGQGMPEPQARAFFGKLSKDYPDGDIVLDAVRGAVTEQPADARAYLKATCQRLAGEKSRSGAPDWTRTAT